MNDTKNTLELALDVLESNLYHGDQDVLKDGGYHSIPFIETIFLKIGPLIGKLHSENSELAKNYEERLDNILINYDTAY